MKVEFTYMWGSWETYQANSADECRDDTDKMIYKTLAECDDKVVQFGKVCCEKVA